VAVNGEAAYIDFSRCSVPNGGSIHAPVLVGRRLMHRPFGRSNNHLSS
jgi:hypothetical protein